MWVEREGLTKPDLAQMLLKVETGEHIGHKHVQYVKAKAFALIPTDVGLLDIDGEPLAMEPFSCELLPGLLRMIVPQV